MRFGIREVADLVLRSKEERIIGNEVFHIGQPVLYIDSATTSSLEQAATTVYATGGRGNARLIAWQGDKTLTLTFTDALLSPIGLSVLSGAGLFHAKALGVSHFHMNSLATMVYNETSGTGTIDLEDAIAEYGKVEVESINETPDGVPEGEKSDYTWKKGDYLARICVKDAPIFIMPVDDDGDIDGKLITGDIAVDGTSLTVTTPKRSDGGNVESVNVMVDYYVNLPGENLYEADITTDEFAGYYYVEGSVLVRDQATGRDLPGNITIPNAKLQSNFTITMASTGDPSTFDFTLDAFPAYTYFDKTKKVLCVVQIAQPGGAVSKAGKPVMPHNESTAETTNELTDDSNLTVPTV